MEKTYFLNGMILEINEVNACKMIHIIGKICAELSINDRYCIVVSKSISSCPLLNLPEIDMILCPTEQRMSHKTVILPV